MADQVTTRRLDDLHLKEGRHVDADRRYEFSMGETTYRLDLNAEHAADFEKMFGPFLDAATPIMQEGTTKVASSAQSKRRRSTGGVSTRRTSKEVTERIRKWADDNGIQLKPKGPLPGEVKQRYAEALGVDVESLA